MDRRTSHAPRDQQAAASSGPKRLTQIAFGHWTIDTARRWLFILALTLTVALPSAARAQTRSSSSAVLILAPEISGRQVLEALAEPQWSELSARSSFALSSAAVPGPDTLNSAYLTIGAGRRMAWSATALPPDAGALTATVTTAGKSVDHLGPRRSQADSALGADGKGRRHTLPGGPDAWVSAASTLARLSDLLIVELPPVDADSALRFAADLARSVDGQGALIVLTSPNPDHAPGGQFGHLAPALLLGEGWNGASATSATTRTPGLLSNTDLAPTLLARLGIPVPRTMEGHVARPAAASLGELAAYERHVRAVGAATIPVLIGWSVCAFVAVGWVLLALRRSPTVAQAGAGRALLGGVVAAPIAMLLVGVASSPGEVQLAVSVGGVTLVIAVAAALLGKRASPLFASFAMLAGVLIGDLLTGGRLLAACLLGDFVNTGVRFYGIGNEYEGLALGSTVLLPFMAQSLAKPGAELLGREGRLVAAGLWPLTLFVVAAPGLGADFGGAIALAVAYGAGAWLGTGRRLDARQVLPGLLLIVIVVVGVVAMDLMRVPGSRSHVGELAAQVLEGGGGRLWEVLGRKAGMNLRMATTPYSLAGLAAVAVLGAICYHLLAASVRRVVASRPLLRLGSSATLLGAVVAATLNDSGIVAGGLAAGCVLLLWLDVMLQDRPTIKSG